MRALRQALASAGGYTLAIEDSGSAAEVFVDIVIFRESLSRSTKSAGDGRHPDASFPRAVLESIDESFCMILDGNNSYLTSDAKPAIERLLEGATQVTLGAVWRTRRPKTPPGRLWGMFLQLGNLFSRTTGRDVLSGLFLLEGGPPSIPQPSYFVVKNGR